MGFAVVDCHACGFAPHAEGAKFSDAFEEVRDGLGQDLTQAIVAVIDR